MTASPSSSDGEEEREERVGAVRDGERARDAEKAERVDVERVADGLADDAGAHHREAGDERHLLELDEAAGGDEQADEHQARGEAADGGHQERAQAAGLRGEQHGRERPQGGRSESRGGAHVSVLLAARRWTGAWRSVAGRRASDARLQVVGYRLRG